MPTGGGIGAPLTLSATDGLHSFDAGKNAGIAESTKAWVSKYSVDFTSETPGDLTPDFGSTHTFAGEAWTLTETGGTVTTFEVNATDGIKFEATGAGINATMDLLISDVIPDIDMRVDQLWYRMVCSFLTERGRSILCYIAWENDGFGTGPTPDACVALGMRNIVGGTATGNDQTFVLGNDNTGGTLTLTGSSTTLAEQVFSIETFATSSYLRHEDAPFTGSLPTDVATAIGGGDGLYSIRFDTVGDPPDDTEAHIRVNFQGNTGTANGFTLKSLDLLRFE